MPRMEKERGSGTSMQSLERISAKSCGLGPTGKTNKLYNNKTEKIPAIRYVLGLLA